MNSVTLYSVPLQHSVTVRKQGVHFSIASKRTKLEFLVICEILWKFEILLKYARCWSGLHLEFRAKKGFSFPRVRLFLSHKAGPKITLPWVAVWLAVKRDGPNLFKFSKVDLSFSASLVPRCSRFSIISAEAAPTVWYYSSVNARTATRRARKLVKTAVPIPVHLIFLNLLDYYLWTFVWKPFAQEWLTSPTSPSFDGLWPFVFNNSLKYRLPFSSWMCSNLRGKLMWKNLPNSKCLPEKNIVIIIYMWFWLRRRKQHFDYTFFEDRFFRQQKFISFETGSPKSRDGCIKKKQLLNEWNKCRQRNGRKRRRS